MPTLADVVRTTTLEAIRRPGAVDVAIVGAGATGGYAAYLLARAGLTVLVLDAGPHRVGPGRRTLIDRVAHRLMGRNGVNLLRRRRQRVQSQCYAWAGAPDAFVDDLDCPYSTPPDRPFVWIRARQLGGRLMIPGHGRQYYRLAPVDMHPPDGPGPRWPFDPADLDPWYTQAELDIQLAGRRDDNPHVPNSALARELTLSESESALIDTIRARWPDAHPMLSRFATPPSFLDLAAGAGRLLVRPGAVARQLHVDAAGCVTGVTWVDTESGADARVDVPLIFLCASALESTRLLMLSSSPRQPGGIGSASGALGRYLMDHIRVRLWGTAEGAFDDGTSEPGRCLFLPRFDVVSGSTVSGRSFGVQIHRSSQPRGRTHFGAFAFGEMAPRPENRVSLDPRRTDAWGIPVLHVDCAHDEADRRQIKHQFDAVAALAEAAGARVDTRDSDAAPPGAANHECGTARMGTDPAESVLDPRNECWDARGLFLTDGACLPSQAYQNPTLTLMALTARACAYVLERRTG